MRVLRAFAVIAIGVAGPLASLSAAAPQRSVTPPQVNTQQPQGRGRGRGNQLPPAPLVTTGLIVGRVIDSGTGKPVAGALVTLAGGPPRTAPQPTPTPARGAAALPPLPPPRVLTDAEGHFAFRSLTRGNYTLGATKPGYAAGAYGRSRPDGPGRPLRMADNERVSDATIRIFKYASITGRISDESGEPIVGENVRAYRRVLVSGRRRFRDAGSVQTDDRGVYRLFNLTPGDYVVCVPMTSITAPLPAPNNPLSSQNLSSTSQVMTSTPPSVRAGGRQLSGDSRFVLQSTGLAPTAAQDGSGQWRGYAREYYPSAHTIATSQPLTLTSGDERSGIDLSMRYVPVSNISGTVIAPDGPAANYVLRLISSDASEFTAEPETASTATDNSGAFMFIGIPEGQYTIQAVRLPRQQPDVLALVSALTSGSSTISPAPPPLQPLLWASTPVSVGNADVAGVSVTMQEGFSISGRFEFTGQRPRPAPQSLTQIAIVVEPSDARNNLPATGPPSRATPDGRFTTAPRLPGKYFLRASAPPPGFIVQTITVNGVNATDAPFDLTDDISNVVVTFTDRIAGVNGTVRDVPPNADPPAVVLFPADSTAWKDFGINPLRMRMTRVTPAGTFAFGSLIAGDYFVAAIRDEFSNEWQDPAFLDVLSHAAERFTLGQGEKRTLTLSVSDARPPGVGRSASPGSEDAGLQLRNTPGSEDPGLHEQDPARQRRFVTGSEDPALQLRNTPGFEDPGLYERADVPDGGAGFDAQDQREAPDGGADLQVRPNPGRHRPTNGIHQQVAPQVRDNRVAEPTGTGSISGTVTLDDGSSRPARLARIRVTGQLAREFRALTDDDGHYSVSWLPAGDYTVVVSKPAYVDMYYGGSRPAIGPGTPVHVDADKAVTGIDVTLIKGAVIAGMVIDPLGQPAPGVRIQILRFVWRDSQRVLVGAGASGPSTTNDRGEYRVYGLRPGSYVVSATPPQPFNQEVRQLSDGEMKAAIAEAARAPTSPSVFEGPRPIAPALPEDLPARAQDGQPVSYSPVFYPGALREQEAAELTVAAGQELNGVTISLSLVPTARLEGRVIGPDGQPATGAQVLLWRATATSSSNLPMLQHDGVFQVAAVPAGHYTLTAVLEDRSAPRVPPAPGAPSAAQTQPAIYWAQQEIDVDGTNQLNLVLPLASPPKISGRVVFEGGPAPDMRLVQVSLGPAASTVYSRSPQPVSPDATGAFTLQDVLPNKYRFSVGVAGPGSGRGALPPPSNATLAFASWAMLSATAAGQDALIAPFEVRADHPIEDAVVTMTNQPAEISGKLVDADGKPVTGLTIVLFPADRTLWPVNSVWISRTQRAGTDGAFRFRGIVPGDYYLAVLTGLDNAEWTDPEFKAQLVDAGIKVSVAKGEKKVQDMKIR